MHKRPQKRSLARRLYAVAYGCCVVFGAIALFGSIGLQLWGSVGAHDGAGAHRHRTFCTGQLWGLRQELEEATLQDMARGRRGEDLTRIEQVRRRTWRMRLTEVERRCQDLPVHKSAAFDLGCLERRYAALIDEMHAVRRGCAMPLDEVLHGLKD